jgi:thymidylate synthase
MNKLDTQYQELLKTLLEFGVDKSDRTGTGTKSIFGYTIRHNMQSGFPLLTTKKMAWKSVVTELLWFLKGDTNIKYLVDNNCHIWDGDAYKNYEREWLKENPPFAGPHNDAILSQREFINRIKEDDAFATRWGDLGPIYGAQWRSWGTYYGIDQISELIEQIKTNPDSRRLLVTAWDPAVITDMVLPPCHYGFQVYTRELSLEERDVIFARRTFISTKGSFAEQNGTLADYLDKEGIPRRAISLMWNQRSVDTFLGLPFNIASYGLLLEILAKEVNMVPDQLIGNLGDVHLYSNHIEQAKEQIGRDLLCDERVDMASTDIHFDPFDFGVGPQVTAESIHRVCDLYGVPRRTRQPYELPRLILPSAITTVDELKPSDFSVENYKSHPAIKAPLSN